MPNSGKGNGEEIETFWNRSCLFSVLQYSDMGIVAEVSYLLQIAVSALHCSVKRLEFQLSSSAFKVSTQSKALMKAQ